ncbi:MAG: NAD(+) synthase [Clostridia bacterium]|jgi:NAD+ synthase (glutamine-hydrolysing)|nr:NAD(+) synthase [Clostridia bacterium]
MNSGLVRVAAAVPEVAVGNLKINKERIAAMIRDAQAKDVSIAAFPELCITSYTLGDLFRQRNILEQGSEVLGELLEETKDTTVLCIVGLPVHFSDKLYNAAVVFQSGEILGVVPKAYIPNYSEYYEQRWFASGIDVTGENVTLAGQSVPFGTDILFECKQISELVLGVELCEDLWVPFPPHAYQAMAGATLFVNISASNELAGKREYRQEMIKQQSSRYVSGFVYVSAGPGESTTDTVFGGHAVLAENGNLLASSERFSFEAQMSITEFDLHRLSHDRILKNTFVAQDPVRTYRRRKFDAQQTVPKYREIERLPFVPGDKEQRDARCDEVFNIQVTALERRIRHTHTKRLIIGVSGGLDSALALMVAVEAAQRAGLKKSAVLGVVMPGFGSTDETQDLGRRLTKATGAELKEISIVNAARAHLKDLGHSGEPDITYENAQARERTQVLMDLANQEHGFVVGTGDLSELALGFCTYAGDQISMYGVNSGVAKTLIKEMVLYVSEHSEKLHGIAKEIVAIPPSPELVPPNETDERQDTQKHIGKYDLNDFFMYYVLRFEMSPKKILLLAQTAYGEYSKNQLREQLKKFYKRFFASQFKRSCMPDGPKVGSVSLSPRGDWRMPSDAQADMWIESLDE